MGLEEVDRVALDAVELVVAEVNPELAVRQAMEVQESHQAHTSQAQLRTQVEVEKMREEAEVANEVGMAVPKEEARNSTKLKGEVGIKAVQAPRTRKRRSSQRESQKPMKA